MKALGHVSNRLLAGRGAIAPPVRTRHGEISSHRQVITTVLGCREGKFWQDPPTALGTILGAHLHTRSEGRCQNSVLGAICGVRARNVGDCSHSTLLHSVVAPRVRVVWQAVILSTSCREDGACIQSRPSRKGRKAPSWKQPKAVADAVQIPDASVFRAYVKAHQRAVGLKRVRVERLYRTTQDKHRGEIIRAPGHAFHRKWSLSSPLGAFEVERPHGGSGGHVEVRDGAMDSWRNYHRTGPTRGGAGVLCVVSQSTWNTCCRLCEVVQGDVHPCVC